MLNFEKLKSLVINGVKLKELAINGVVVWKSGYKNWVPYSTESDGVTIYNGGLGYKNDYRVRSGGAETAASQASCTGFIPVQPNDVIRISGCEFSEAKTQNAINISDSSFTNLGQMAMNNSFGYGSLEGTTYGSSSSVVEETTGVYKWLVPPESYGVAYIRVTGYFSGGSDGASLIVTVNEELA